MRTTIDKGTDGVTAVWHSLLGGKFILRLRKGSRKTPGNRSCEVLDDSGNVIGGADDYIYGGRGFALHTKAFGGFVPEEQIVFVK